MGAQLGLLTAVALTLVRGPSPPAVAAPSCPKEAPCAMTKPIVLFVVDYSTAMNEPYNLNTTRWQAARWALKDLLWTDNGLLGTHFMLGLLRFGHDPDPDQAGTLIPGDASGLVDGTRLDIAPYDLQDPNHEYYECTHADAIAQALTDLPSPLGGQLQGIDRWTRGGLERARSVLQQAANDHPGDLGKRPATVVLLTGGPWTGPAGGPPLVPASANPVSVAQDMFEESGIPTFVITIGDAVDAPFAADLAAVGGTGQPLPITCPASPGGTLDPLAESLAKTISTGSCGQDLPRVMFLLDASSSMLNIGGGTQHAPPGMGGWDQIRDALAGSNSIFAHPVMGDLKRRVEDVAHVGLTVFGHNAPAEEKIVVDYGLCLADNVAWALDPETSCEAPGCVDPWGLPPITWTFKDGAKVDPPGFAAKTVSHMPRCNFAQQQPKACVGSGTYTHLGLQLVAQNLASYKQACLQPAAIYPCTADTAFLNILITDGKYNSTDAQVQAPLEQMYSDGVTTHVIGYGDAVQIQSLAAMADWGSGGLRDGHKANNQNQLEEILALILDEALAAVAADPCCSGSCAQAPEPTTAEPDPVPETSWGEYCSWSDSGTSSSGSSDTGDDPTTGGTTTSTTSTTSTGTTSSSDGESSSGTGTPPPTTTTDPTPTTGASAGDATTASGEASTGEVVGDGDGDSGCGCASTGTRDRLALLIPLALLLGRRRRDNLRP